MSETNDTDRIERDLDRTRERLSADLSALQQRLSPGQMVDEALGYVRTDAARDFGRNLGHQVQANPLALGLVGVGLAWLMMGSRDRQYAYGDAGYGGSSYPGTEYGGTGYKGGESGEDLGTKARRAAERLSRGSEETAETFRLRMLEAKGAVLGVSRHAGETADAYSGRIDQAIADSDTRFSRMRERAAGMGRGIMSSGGKAAGGVGSAVSSGAGSIRDTAYAGYEGVSSGLNSAGQAISDGGHTLADAIERNPLLLGAVGLTVGGLLGALLPATRTERQAFGEFGERARDELRHTADDLKERASRVAGEVVEAGRKAADDVIQAGDKAARQEGLHPDSVREAADRERRDQSAGGSAGRSSAAAGGPTTGGTTPQRTGAMAPASPMPGTNPRQGGSGI